MVALALLVLACAKAARAPSGCTKEDECGTGSFCIQKTCVVDAKPVAAFTGPTSPTALDLLTFDGSASSDPDAEGGHDAVASYAWTFAAVAAACDAPVVAGNGPSAAVRFACPGSYDATLVVTDRKGLESDPFTQRLEVAGNAGPPPVTAGADLVRPHACLAPAPGAADPRVRCTVRTEDGSTDEDLPLSASSTARAVGEVRFHWSVTPPPGLTLSANRTATFSPSPDVAAPSVHLEVVDGAISGDWVFRVEARDDAGLIGTAATRLSVTNRPPEIAVASTQLLPHRFDAAASQFTAAGTLGGVAVTDPDGDPVASRTVRFTHTGDGEGTFEGSDLGASIQLRISVPYRSAADAQHLIGGAELQRAVAIEVQDVNGATARKSVEVLVANTPPILDGPAGATVSVPHRYASGTYSAHATLGHWTDPDGDPLTVVAGPVDPDCWSLALSAGSASVQCTRAFQGTLPTGYFGAHTVDYVTADPWERASAGERLTVRILNQPPTLPLMTGPASTLACDPTEDASACCEWGGPKGTICVVYPMTTPAVSYAFTPEYSDPDGDPVLVTAPGSAQSVVCNGTCSALSAPLTSVETCSGTEVRIPITAKDDPDPAVPAVPGTVVAPLRCSN
jgi:hypothetical protein